MATRSSVDWGRLDGLATGRAVAGPAGWLNWCMAAEGRCAPASGPISLAATPDSLAILDRVQTRGEQRVAAEPEPPGRDLWQADARSGDCEDFALAKRQRLRAAGLPTGAVRLATAALPDGELHAVLTVETDQRHPGPGQLQQRGRANGSLDYAWLRVQGTDGTLRVAGARRRRLGPTIRRAQWPDGCRSRRMLGASWRRPSMPSSSSDGR